MKVHFSLASTFSGIHLIPFLGEAWALWTIKKIKSQLAEGSKLQVVPTRGFATKRVQQALQGLLVSQEEAWNLGERVKTIDYLAFTAAARKGSFKFEGTDFLISEPLLRAEELGSLLEIGPEILGGRVVGNSGAIRTFLWEKVVPSKVGLVFDVYHLFFDRCADGLPILQEEDQELFQALIAKTKLIHLQERDSEQVERWLKGEDFRGYEALKKVLEAGCKADVIVELPASLVTIKAAINPWLALKVGIKAYTKTKNTFLSER